MKKFDLEFAVGLFMIVGILCLGYISIKLGKMEILGGKGYEIEAIFSNSGGLKTGSSVVIWRIRSSNSRLFLKLLISTFAFTQKFS